MTIAEGKKPYNGINGIWTQYHIRCHPYIVIGIIEIRIITCACIYFKNTMDLPWDPYLVSKDQPIYSAET